MKIAEINELSVEELIERIEAEKANLQKAKVNHTISPIENTNTLRWARRDIARMMTVLANKKSNINTKL